MSHERDGFEGGDGGRGGYAKGAVCVFCILWWVRSRWKRWEMDDNRQPRNLVKFVLACQTIYSRFLESFYYSLKKVLNK